MASWTDEELDAIGGAEELHLASRRRDGRLRAPVTIWVVRRGDYLYVRSWRGRASAWFRGVQDRHEGHIRAGGVDKDVSFADADRAIDAAYRAKYRRYADSHVPPMVSPDARVATLRLVPGAAGEGSHWTRG